MPTLPKNDVKSKEVNVPNGVEIVLLYGKNSFAIDNRLNEIKEEFIQGGGDKDAITHMELNDDSNIGDLLISTRNTSLFSTKRLVVIRNISAMQGEDDTREQLYSTADENNLLILVDDALQQRSKIVSELKKRSNAHVIVCSELNEQELHNWILEYTRTLRDGADLASASTRELIRLLGTNQQHIAQEIQKLVSSTQTNEDITTERINQLIVMTPQSSVFAMLDATLAGNNKRAIELYDEQLAQGIVPQQLLGMVVWQITQLAIVVDAKARTNKELTDIYGISSYAVSKLRPIANNLNNRDIANIVKELLRVDQLSRTETSADEGLRYLLSYLSVRLK